MLSDRDRMLSTPSPYGERNPQPHSSPRTVPPPRPTGPPPPIGNAACIALATAALREAREAAAKQSSASAQNPKGPVEVARVTIDLSHQRIASLPLEVVELIKDEIERLALAHNQITDFPPEFSSLSRIRYLNLRSNFIREFPLALTRLPSLEILDISRNRLRALPPDFGTLMNLKVLSLSKNKLSVLPTYIADMKDLKILKLDHNNIVFPPREVWDVEGPHKDMPPIEPIQRFLRLHAEKNATQDTESGGSRSNSLSDSCVDEGEGDISFTHSLISTPGEEDPNGINRTVRPLRVNGVTLSSADRPSGHPSPNSRRIQPSSSPGLASAGFEDPKSAAGNSSASQFERHRSNSESTAGGARERRMGMPPPPRSGPAPARGNPGFLQSHDGAKPGDEDPRRHARGLSHDSQVNAANHPASRSPREHDTDKRPGQYFRRLSSLPEHKRSSLSSERVGEAARGILYAMSTLHKPVEQYVHSGGSENGKVERALYNANIHIGSLVTALEAYEEKDDEPGVQKVIDACHDCISAFRQVLSFLHSSLKESEANGSGPDLRYARTLVLLLYGSYVEVKQSWDILQPLLISPTMADTAATSISASSTNNSSSLRVLPNPISTRAQTMPNSLRYPAHLRRDDFGHSTIPESGPYSAATPRAAFFNQVPGTPGFPPQHQASLSDSSTDQTEQLQAKFSSAINAALVTLPTIDREIKALAPQNVQPSVTLKLREVSTLCNNGIEQSKKLAKTRWDAFQDGDIVERRKFWDDANKFTQLIISIAELARHIIVTPPSFSIPKRILSLISSVVRPTKDLYIVMHSTTFRNMNDPHQQHSHHNPPPTPHNLYSPVPSTPGFAPPATPLSAALGPAAQATMPPLEAAFMMPASFGGGYGMSGSRTGTGLSAFSGLGSGFSSAATTMTRETEGIGMSFANGSAPNVLSGFAGGRDSRDRDGGGLERKPELRRAMTSLE